MFIPVIIDPQNTTVIEGNSVTFHCISNSTEIPFWLVNDQIYLPPNLPPRHNYYDNQQLIVANVSASDNGTTYQCALPPDMSEKAILTVVRGKTIFLLIS